jgi:hypothetical protein
MMKVLMRKSFGSVVLGATTVKLIEKKGVYTVIVKNGTSRKEWDFTNQVLAEQCFSEQCLIAEFEN